MALVFDVRADLALFRKPYTTTSMISFPFPPPTAVAGILAAVVGVDHGSGVKAQRADYWTALAGTRVAVGLRSPVEWTVTAINLMKFKSASADMGEHIRAKHQYVKRPHYRIFVAGGELYSRLKERLSRGEHVYTPYLGVAYALAEIDYIGQYQERNLRLGEGELAVSTVVPHYEGLRVDVLKSGGVHRETIPFRLDNVRRLQETVTVYYPEFRRRTAQPPCLYLKATGELRISWVGEDKVAWFRAW